MTMRRILVVAEGCVMVGDDVVIVVDRVIGDKASLSISAPELLPILTEDEYDKLQRERNKTHGSR